MAGHRRTALDDDAANADADDNDDDAEETTKLFS